MDLEFLGAFKEDWKPVSKPALIAWLVFFGLFLLHALTSKSGFLIIDYVFLPIHESGHLLFGYFGSMIGTWGGTLMQLLVPFALTVYFAYERHTAGTAFCAFFFFENFLNISVYMADARRQELQLVTVGSGEDVMHDWFVIFSSLGVLERDTTIAAIVRVVGWVGMLAAVGWLIYRARSSKPPTPLPPWLRRPAQRHT
jgi:hypothetical protein